MADEPMLCPSLERALGFLEQEFMTHGCWQDFTSQTFGTSTLWVTGYTGWCLCGAGVDAASLDEVCAHLTARRHDAGWGWGYTEVGFPSDADTTALCTLLLMAQGALSRSAMQQIGAFLLAHRQDDGGFATFRSPEILEHLPYFAAAPSVAGWCSSHVSVTATVIQALVALGTVPDAPIFARAFDFLQQHRTTDGLWSDYWWYGPFYATYQVTRAACCLIPRDLLPIMFDRTYRMLLELQHCYGYWTNVEGGEPCPFSTALALRTLALIAPDDADTEAIARSVRWLVEIQDADGSWVAPLILQIPWPADLKPDPARRKLKAPIRRVFSTAATYAALATLRQERALGAAVRAVGT